MNIFKILVSSALLAGGVSTSADVGFTGQSSVVMNGKVATYGVPLQGFMGPTGDDYLASPSKYIYTTPFDLGLQNVKAIIQMPAYDAAIKTNGLAYYWGGIGSRGTSSATPQLIPMNNVLDMIPMMTSIGMYGMDTELLKANPDGVTGTAYLWHSEAPERAPMVDPNLPNNIVQLSACGSGMTFALDANGMVWSRNGTSAIAGRDIVDGTAGVWGAIPTLDHVKKVFAPCFATFALHTDGSMSAWGLSAGHNYPWFVNLDEHDAQFPTKIPDLTDVVTIIGQPTDDPQNPVGGVYFVKSDGTVLCTEGMCLQRDGDILHAYTHVLTNFNVADLGFTRFNTLVIKTKEGAIYSMASRGLILNPEGQSTNLGGQDPNTYVDYLTPGLIQQPTAGVLWNDPESTVQSVTDYCATLPTTDVTYFPICAPNSDTAVATYIQVQGDLKTAEDARNQLIQDNANNLHLLPGKYDELKAQNDQAQADLAKAQTDLATAQTAKAKAESDLVTVQSQLTTAQSNLASVQNQLDKSQSDLTTAQSNLANIQSQLDKAQSELTTAQTKVNDLESQLSASQKAYNDAKAAADKAAIDLALATTDKEKYQVAANKAAADLVTAQNNLTSVQSQLASAKSDLTAAQAAEAKAKSDLAIAQTAKTKAENDLTSVQNQLTTVKNDLASVQGQLEISQASLTTAQGQVSSLEGQLDVANAKMQPYGKIINNEGAVSTSKVKGVKSAYKAFLKAKATLEKAMLRAENAGKLIIE